MGFGFGFGSVGSLGFCGVFWLLGLLDLLGSRGSLLALPLFFFFPFLVLVRALVPALLFWDFWFSVL